MQYSELQTLAAADGIELISTRPFTGCNGTTFVGRRNGLVIREYLLSCSIEIEPRVKLLMAIKQLERPKYSFDGRSLTMIDSGLSEAMKQRKATLEQEIADIYEDKRIQCGLPDVRCDGL